MITSLRDILTIIGQTEVPAAPQVHHIYDLLYEAGLVLSTGLAYGDVSIIGLRESQVKFHHLGHTHDEITGAALVSSSVLKRHIDLNSVPLLWGTYFGEKMAPGYVGGIALEYQNISVSYTGTYGAGLYYGYADLSLDLPTLIGVTFYNGPDTTWGIVAAVAVHHTDTEHIKSVNLQKVDDTLRSVWRVYVISDKPSGTEWPYTIRVMCVWAPVTP